jgi:hypothetical protein
LKDADITSNKVINLNFFNYLQKKAKNLEMPTKIVTKIFIPLHTFVTNMSTKERKTKEKETAK